MRTALRPLVLLPLIAVAFASAASGFVVQRQLVHTPHDERVLVSVVALAEPEPTPTPSPEPTAAPQRRTRVGSEGSRSEDRAPGGISGCPAGCTCESRPPQGVVIVCR